MAIDSISGRTRPPVISNSGQKAEVGGDNKLSAKPAEQSDSIAITDIAQGIKKTLESSGSGDVVDIDRVNAVKKALAEGSYQINPEQIAEKMIQHEKLMSQL